MNHKENTHEKSEMSVKRYVMVYTIGFCVLFLAAFALVFITGKGLLWTTDAKPQYLTYLQYMGQYMRDMIRRALQGDVTLRMFDFSIGMGEDVRSVFRMHLTDFLSVLIPSRYTEIFYNIMMVVRYYLAGLAFSAFCFYRSLSRFRTLAGAMVYVFCGYVFHFGVKHPVFTAPLIFLPLLLIALDRLIRKKRGWVLLYSFMVGLSLMTNYYFLYMNTFAMGVYALLVFGEIYPKGQGRAAEFGRMMWRIVSGYVLGCGMAMVFFLPTMARLMNSVRVGSGKELEMSLWHYPSLRSLSVLMNLITPARDAGSATYLNFAVIVIPAVTILFVRKWREHWRLKVVWLVELMLLVLPAGGYMMSGFSAFNNRWTYLVSFTAALTVTVMLEELQKMTLRQMQALAGITAVYGVLTIIFRRDDIRTWAAFVQLLLCTGILLRMNRKKLWSGQAGRRILAGIVCVSITVNGMCTFVPFITTFLYELYGWNEAAQSMRDSEYQYLAALPDDEFYRTDSHLVVDNYENMPIFLGYHGISLYNSVVNGEEVRYHKELENAGISAIHRIYSMDGRAPMEALANVKYYMTKVGEEKAVPYGFSADEEHSGQDYLIYQNDYPLAFGYTYDTWISEEDYEAMDGLTRQEAMLDGVVISPNADVTGMQQYALKSYATTEKPVLLSSDETLKIKQNGTVYRVKEANASMKLSYQKKAGYEAYLHFKNLQNDTEYSRIYVNTSDLQKKIVVRGLTRDYSLGRTEYLVYLGYSETEGEDTMDVIFGSRGKYTMDDYEICYIPRDEYAQKIAARNEGAMQEVTFSMNRIDGTAVLKEDRLMVLSVPYSSGWKVYVDGEKITSFRANSMYTGIRLSAGEHKIELRYTTPGLILGGEISAVSVLIYLGLWMMIRKRKKVQECGIQ
ncbi:MAG: YfhO family protein [Eubacteriales bacterium]|nr:YfhO family protein [Eubacteriales bacterium]